MGLLRGNFFVSCLEIPRGNSAVASCKAKWENVQTEELFPNNGGRKGEKGGQAGKQEYRRKALGESLNLSRVGEGAAEQGYRIVVVFSKEATNSRVIVRSVQNSVKLPKCILLLLRRRLDGHKLAPTSFCRLPISALCPVGDPADVSRECKRGRRRQSHLLGYHISLPPSFPDPTE